MGLQRTPPPQSTTSLLPRPIPPPYATPVSSGRQQDGRPAEASSSRVTTNVPVEELDVSSGVAASGVVDVVEGMLVDEEEVRRTRVTEAPPAIEPVLSRNTNANVPPASSTEA